MSEKYAVGQSSIADTGPGSPFAPLFFDYRETLLSQYANSPVILAILGNLNENLDPQVRFDAFYRTVWNVETATGYGLDVWGRIVGVNRVLQVPLGGFLGWAEATDAEPFGSGVWSGIGTLTENYTLTDSAYRRLVLAKAALNITNASIPSVNRALLALFPARGNSYVRDDGGMKMTYVFGAPLDPVELAIVAQSGVLPKPIGVTVSSEVPSAE